MSSDWPQCHSITSCPALIPTVWQLPSHQECHSPFLNYAVFLPWLSYALNCQIPTQLEPQLNIPSSTETQQSGDWSFCRCRVFPRWYTTHIGPQMTTLQSFQIEVFYPLFILETLQGWELYLIHFCNSYVIWHNVLHDAVLKTSFNKNSYVLGWECEE